MNEKNGLNAFAVLIQINGTEFHVDKCVRQVWKVSKIEDIDDVLVPAIAQLLDRL